MPVDEKTQARILTVIVTRFVNRKQATPRKGLILEFKDSDAIADLLMRTVLRRKEGTSEEYLPTVGAFALCDDPQLRERARFATTVVLHALQNIYRVEESRPEHYTFIVLQEYVQRIYPDRPTDDETIKLGLYLARDFGVLNGYRTNHPDDTEVISFQVGERIITIGNLDQAWDTVTAGFRPRPMAILEAYSYSPEGLTFGPTPSPVLPIPLQGMPAENAPGYQFHPEIEKVSGKLYRQGNYRQAVLDSYIHVIDRVKTEAGLADNALDGDDLVNRAFNDKKPIVRFNDLRTQADRDEQRGIFFLFKGLVGFRNVKGHVVTEFTDPLRAHEYLCLSSLLMRLLDIAKELKTA